MGLKPFRRIHVWRRCRRMPWFTWAGAWPMLAPTWLRRLLAEHLIPVRREGDLPLVCFPNGDVVAAPPGTRRPVLEVLTQYQAARYLDHYEARTALRDGDVALDGGAGYGTFTLLASRLVGPAGRVVAIEPVPDSLAALEGTVRANALDNVSVVRGAVGGREGTVTIALPRGRYAEATGSADRAPLGPEVETFDVPCRTVDGLVDELALPRVDFIKLNIEGMEEECLRGAAETLRAHRPRLALSLAHLDDDAARLPAVLRDLEPSYVTAISSVSRLCQAPPVLLAAPDGVWGRGDNPLLLRTGD